MMYPSYPAFVRAQCHDLAVEFAIPNKRVAEQILNDSNQDENLRVKAAAQILMRQVSSLARIMRRRRVKVHPLGHNDLAVTLFLPPPPCPEPKTKALSRRIRGFVSKLATIVEEPRSDELDGTTWITMFNYMPKKRKSTHMYL
jgi:hypothetical protein